LALCAQGHCSKYGESISYANRGEAYFAKGDLERAIADYGEAIRGDPTLARGYIDRGNAYFSKGDLERAIAEYSQRVEAEPKNDGPLFDRGMANLYAGALPKALADFDQATALAPKNGYDALWLDIVGARNGVASRLPQAIAQIDMTVWPAPVIRLFLGQTTPAAVLAAADSPKPKTKQGQVCEADFYSGELALRQDAKDEAARLFRLAASDCPKDFPEWLAANAELKALGAAP
jgi:lipoprotein NlpI